MASNISDNYEKVALGVAILIAVALGVLAYLNLGKLPDAFQDSTVPPRPAPELPGKVRLDEATAGLAEPVVVNQATVSGTNRQVNLFVGTPWFIQSDNSTVDLGDPDEPPVHPPIPNEWWLEYGIDPGYADSPARDFDEDGFSNREEFDVKTDPTDPDAHPELIDKVRVAELIDDRFLLDFSSTTGDKFKFLMRTRIDGRLAEVRSDFIPPGGGDDSIFFNKEGAPGQYRFRLKEVVTEPVALGEGGATKDENFAIIEDLKPNLKEAGRVYKVPYTGRGEEYSDYKVVLYLDAIGEENNKFEVLENTSFGLPYKEDAEDKPFLFKGVNEAGQVVIEWTADGETKTRELDVPNP